MADKVDKPKKKAKPKKDEKGVLAALPATRPERIGTRRAEPAAPRARTKPASNGAKAAPAAAAKATGTKRTRPKTASRTSSSRSTAARPKAAAPHTFEPTQASESAAKAARPRPVSEGAPGIGTGGTAPDERSQESARPSGVELASTAVKAAGEVAQLGITIGGHLLKRAVERLPRP